MIMYIARIQTTIKALIYCVKCYKDTSTLGKEIWQFDQSNKKYSFIRKSVKKKSQIIIIIKIGKKNGDIQTLVISFK